MSQRINIALVYGGPSVEHDVSVISARNIQDNIDTSRFNLYRIGIDKSGKWCLMNTVGKDYDNGHKLSLSLDASNPNFLDTQTGQAFRIDVAFVIVHGTDGEDGTIQGFFKMMKIPVVGSDVMGSAISMNKMVSKKLLMFEGIPTAKCIFLNINEEKPAYEDVHDQLGSPLIIKPANLGSSVGVSKVIDKTSFDNAINEAFKYDTFLLMEEFVEGKELECSIIGNTNPMASPPGEVELKSDYDFYSFDAKYVDGESCILHIPADVSDEINEKVKKESIRAYQVLGCADFARVDLFLKSDDTVLINEINTLPGFTNISMYPKLCELLGISYKNLISQLIDLSIKRFDEGKKLETNYLSGLS